MTSLNRVELMGTLAEDPKLGYTLSGKPVASFTLNVASEQQADSGLIKSQLNSFPVIVWGKLGELCNKFLTRGSWVYLQGSLVTEKTVAKVTIHDDECEDCDVDEVKYFAQLVATKIEFLEHNSAHEAQLFLAQLANRESVEDGIALPLTQLEAGIIWYSIINGLGKTTVLDEEQKEQLREIADCMEEKRDRASSEETVILHATGQALSDINGFLHTLQNDSRRAYNSTSAGADGFVGNTGVRLSELIQHVTTLADLIQTTEQLLNDRLQPVQA
jgi:single stranded DNA-binding protein